MKGKPELSLEGCCCPANLSLMHTGSCSPLFSLGVGLQAAVPQGEERQEEPRDLTRATTDNLQGASFEHCVQAGSSLCWNLFAVRSESNLVPSPGLRSFLYVIKLVLKFSDHFPVSL